MSGKNINIEENKKVAREWFEHMNRAEIDKAYELFADDAVCWIPGTMPEFSGYHTKAEMLKLTKGICLGWFKGGLRLTIQGMTAEGDRVATEAESYGRLPNGVLYNNTYHFLMVIRDGKIIEHKEYSDMLQSKDVLGEYGKSRPL